MVTSNNQIAWGEIPDQVYETAKMAGNVGISPHQFLEGIGIMKGQNDVRSPGIGAYPRSPGIPAATKGFTENPFEIYTNKGIRERYYPISYYTLREIERKNPVISAIVNCRCSQLRPFGQESLKDYEPGYKISLRDKERKPSAKEKKKMKFISDWFYNAGRTDFVGWMDREDNLLSVMEKGARDLLVIDKMTTEMRYDKSGKLVDFWALDGGTIRRVMQTGYTGNYTDFDPRAYSVTNTKLSKEMIASKMIQVPKDIEKIKFVQRINGKLIAAFERKDMIYDSMQKRSDVMFYGEGYPRTEQAMHAVTAFLFALAYNAEQFNFGTVPKIALAFKDGNFSESQLIDLQDQWISSFRGIKGAWRIPMFNQEVSVIDLLKSPKDMEHGKYMEFTGSLICAIFNIDPQEIGMRWQYSQNVLNDNAGSRLKHSKDRGLNDLLGQLADHFNKIMYFAGWGQKYRFEFTGIEPEDSKERSLLETEAVKRDLTVNELRKQKDMPPIEGGDIILDPTYMQGLQAAQMAEQEAQQAEGAEGGSAGFDEDMGNAVDETVDDIFKAARPVKTARTLLI